MTEAFNMPDDSLDPRFRELVSAEFSPGDGALILLLEAFHNRYGYLAQFDQANDDALEDVSVVVHAQQQPRYTQRDNDPNVAPSEYDEIEVMPKVGSSASDLIERIFVRHPIVSGEDFAIFDPGYSYIPNDVFVEIVYKDGNNHRYLVNNRGVTPYASGEAIDYDESEFEDPSRRPDVLPNVFLVEPGHNHWFAALIDAPTLYGYIFDDSELQQRGKNQDPEA